MPTDEEAQARETEVKTQRKVQELLDTFKATKTVTQGRTAQVEERLKQLVRPLHADAIWPGNPGPMFDINGALFEGYKSENQYVSYHRLKVRDIYGRYSTGLPLERIGALFVLDLHLCKVAADRLISQPYALAFPFDRGDVAILMYGCLYALAHMVEKSTATIFNLQEAFKRRKLSSLAMADLSIQVVSCSSPSSQEFRTKYLIGLAFLVVGQFSYQVDLLPNCRPDLHVSTALTDELEASTYDLLQIWELDVFLSFVRAPLCVTRTSRQGETCVFSQTRKVVLKPPVVGELLVSSYGKLKR